MSRVIYHPDTGTFMALDDCVVVDIPDTDELKDCDAIEAYLECTECAGKITVEVGYAS